MDTSKLTPFQRQQRQNIRNAYLVSSIKEMEEGQRQQDAFGKSVLQEMIDTCRSQGVDNFGKTTD